nr:hypothetical protein [Tanacetum cinerariifolium]
MRTKPGLDTLSFDDLYNNLRVFEGDVKCTTASSSSSSNTQNVAFVSADNTSNTNDVSTAYSVSSPSVSKSHKKGSSSYTNEVAMISMRIKKFYKRTCIKLQFDTRDPVGFDKTKVKCFNYHKMGHFARDCRAKGNQDSRRKDVGYNGNKARDNGRRLAYQDDSKALVTIDGEDIDWSGHVKEDTQNYAMMAYSSNNSGSEYESVFMNKECDLEDTPINDRYAKGIDAVPPRMTGNYIPSGPDVEIDYSKFTNGPKQTSADESDSKPIEYAFSESDSSVETTTSMPAPVDNALKIVCKPKVWTDAPIIEEYESDSDDDSVAVKGNKETAVRASAVFLALSTVIASDFPGFATLPVFISGGYVAFGGSNGRITGKGKIKAGSIPISIAGPLITLNDDEPSYPDDPLMPHLEDIYASPNLPFGKKAIGTKCVYRNKKDEMGDVVRNKVRLVAQGHRKEEGIDYDEVFSPVARIEAISIFLAFAFYMGFIVYQIHVKSAFLYGTIDEEVYITQPPGFVDPKFPNKKEDGIFISQDKYVAEILKKFDFLSVKTASTPIETQKPIVKDKEAADVVVHLYRSMIGSLMYLTASRLDIMFEVYACFRFQVTPKTLNHQAVKRIFRHIKGHPKLGLWYPKESSFYLEAYSDSNYAGVSLKILSRTRKPNGDALRKCILSGPYKPTTVLVQAVAATDDSLAIPEHATQYQKEVNELHAKRLARNANPLALVATAQANQYPYYQISKSHKSYAPSPKPLIPTRSHTTTRYKGKEIAKPITPPFETASKEDNDPKQAKRDKYMQKNLALIAKTMNVAGARENVGSPVVQQSGIQCFNCKEFGHFAKEYRKPKKVKDFAYQKEKMLFCGTGNSFTYDTISESYDEVPNPPPQCHFNVYLCQICESNSHYGYECSQRVPLVYEPEPCYIPNFNDNCYSHDLPGVNPLIDHHCCHECGNSLNDFFCYQCTCEFCENSAHVGYNCPAQVPSLKSLPSFPQQYPCCEDCGIPVCYDDDDDYNSAITPNEPVNSLSMGDEHLNTILATKSDEFIKSCVENLVPNLNESEGENGCDLPSCFTTFSNILFDADDESDSSDYQSCSDEDLQEEIYSNPLFEEEIISIKIDQHHFDAESDLVESLFNRDSSIISSSSKIDSLLDEFADIHLIERLLYDNSSPRPPKEFVSKNYNANIESFSPSPIPVKDSDSYMEEIDLSFNPNNPMPPSIEDDDDDSEGDTLSLERLLHDDPIPLPDTLDFSYEV